MEIKSLEHTAFDTLFRSFQRAFSDYEIHFDKEEVRSMLKRRGYTPRLSFAAFDKGEIAAFTLNGIGTFDGIPTAYDTGTGTVKEHRGEGLAGKIFSHSLPYLREAGINRYLLEVLQNNSKAIAVYHRMDFKETRELDCYRQEIARINIPESKGNDCTIIPVGLDFIRRSQRFADFTPSWQNGMESIERGVSQLVFLGAVKGGEEIGFCVLDPNTGDITQIAVRDEHRRQGVGTRLLRRAIEEMHTEWIKVLNVDFRCHTLPAFLKSRNIPEAAGQYEMVKELAED